MSPHDRPTLPAWCVSAISDLTVQIDRLATGHACRDCLGSGITQHVGKFSAYHRECATCVGCGYDRTMGETPVDD